MSAAKRLEELQNVPPAVRPEFVIEIRKVHYSASLSDETSAFTADVYANGRKVGDAQNDGHGGSTFVHLNPDVREAIQRQVSAMPAKVINYPGAEPLTIEPSIDGLVDDLLEKYLDEREEKRNRTRIEKDALKIAARGFHPVLVKNGRAYIVAGAKAKTDADLEATAARIVSKFPEMKGSVAAFVELPAVAQIR